MPAGTSVVRPTKGLSRCRSPVCRNRNTQPSPRRELSEARSRPRRLTPEVRDRQEVDQGAKVPVARTDRHPRCAWSPPPAAVREAPAQQLGQTRPAANPAERRPRAPRYLRHSPRSAGADRARRRYRAIRPVGDDRHSRVLASDADERVTGREQRWTTISSYCFGRQRQPTTCIESSSGTRSRKRLDDGIAAVRPWLADGRMGAFAVRVIRRAHELGATTAATVLRDGLPSAATPKSRRTSFWALGRIDPPKHQPRTTVEGRPVAEPDLTDALTICRGPAAICTLGHCGTW